MSDTKIQKIEPVGFLKAKLNRPRVTRDLVVRPRLLELLNRGLDGPVTLVSAPAGFGKTTLVSSWLDGVAAARGEGAAPLGAAWLSLDEQDGDLIVFLRYFIAALRTLFPDAGSETLALLAAPQQLPLEELFTTLNNEIEVLPQSFVLVLDDYHLLGGQAVHEFLNGLIRHWPRPLHLVLISRVDPSLPLANLRARGKIAEIRAADLRFNAEETAAYLDHALQMPLGQQGRSLLAQHTEGWIAALRLATLSLRMTQVGSFPPAAAQAGTSMSDYLQDEILEQQVPAMQMFLLKTSMLDRFCASLCEAVVGEVDPAWSVRACIDWLEHADLLSASPDGRTTWYRYHALVRDFLRDRLQARFGAEEVAGLQRKAAAWFAQEGLLHEAVRHALEGRDFDLAASMVESRLRDELNREDRGVLEHWLNVLPVELVERRPLLLMTKVWALQPTWQLGQQAKVLSRVETLLEEGGGAGLPAEDRRLLRGQILELRAQEAYLNNDLARCLAYSEEALGLLPASWTYVRGGAIVYWGLAMGASGRAQAAERVLLDEYESLDDRTTGYALRILHALCFNYLNAGQLEPAGQTAYVMLQQALRGQKVFLQGWAHYNRGLVAYQRNDLDAAGVHFAEVVDQRYRTQSLAAHSGLTYLALVRQARGESAEALRLVEVLSGFQLEQGGREEDALHSLRARLLLDQGHEEGAFRWADSFTAPVPDRPLLWADVPHITKARILLARNTGGDARLALQILDDLLDVVERTHNTRCKITILALRALALDALDQGEGDALDRGEGDALATLQEAVDLARPGGFLRAFVDLGPSMEGLLARLAAQSSAPGSIVPILAAFPGSGTGTWTGDRQAPSAHRERPTPGLPALVEPLTARELEVLTLLREPLPPKEIARQLDISYLTVKRHTVNVYGKLGVNTRWDAVNKAVELGILPPR